MKITNIHIDSFGGIKDKTIELDNGINLINGENGSGKTLIAAFILFIFYGFSDRNEKKLRSDISSGVSLGCADIVTDNGEAFTIHRKELASGRSEVRVVTPTGESFDGWRAVGEPGDFFLGMNAQTFARSAFISHTDGAVIHGDPTEAARNLLSSGSES
ncbi:MAG: AAA family ATPase, partial [Clostridia bacterium]|nr:AAA family ATPase [Clostridia bacterium]